jgi:hypothetical protein
LTRRGSTWIVVAAVLAIAAAGLADALRGSGRVTSTTTKTKTKASPARSAPRGVLYYTDENCTLRGLELTSRRPASAPRGVGCRFTVSPQADTAALPGADWAPDETTVAEARAGSVVVARSSSRLFAFPGSAPAFQPDGSLTFVHRGAITWMNVDCARVYGSTGQRARFARCTEVLLAAEDIRRASLQESLVGPWRVRGLAWLDSGRAVAVIDVRVRGGQRESLVVIFRGSSVGTVVFRGVRVSDLKISPFRRRFGFLAGGRLYVFTAAGTPVTVPSFSTDVRGFDFSPDDHWIATATRDGVEIFPTEAADRQAISVSVRAADIAWRAT